MFCALTLRKLKSGSFDEFRKVFMEGSVEDMPADSQFFMVRNTKDPDEVITFGLFEGDPEELRKSPTYEGYDEMMEKIKQFVESSGPDGFYEVVEHQTG